MATAAPPAYSNESAPPEYTRDEKIAIQSAAASEANKPEVKSQLDVDMNTFTKQVKDIDDSFRVAKNKLGEIDAKGYDKPFQPTWSGFYDRYKDLLNESQRTATKMATEAEKFGTFILPYVTGKKSPGDSKAERLQEVQDYIQDSKDMQATADGIADRFNSLAKDINGFTMTFTTFADARLKEDNAQLKELNSSIAAAKKRIEELNFQLPLLIGALAVLALGAVALCLIFPTFAGAIASGALAAGAAVAKKIYDNIQERKETSAKLASDQAKAKALAAEIADIQKARTDLNSLAGNEISTVVHGINMLSGFWRTMSDDVHRVESYLKATKREISEYQSDPEAPVIIVSYLNSGNSIYSGLAQALKAYSAGITKAKA